MVRELSYIYDGDTHMKCHLLSPPMIFSARRILPSSHAPLSQEQAHVCDGSELYVQKWLGKQRRSAASLTQKTVVRRSEITRCRGVRECAMERAASKTIATSDPAACWAARNTAACRRYRCSPGCQTRRGPGDRLQERRCRGRHPQPAA